MGQACPCPSRLTPLSAAGSGESDPDPPQHGGGSPGEEPQPQPQLQSQLPSREEFPEDGYIRSSRLSLGAEGSHGIRAVRPQLMQERRFVPRLAAHDEIEEEGGEKEDDSAATVVLSVASSIEHDRVAGPAGRYQRLSKSVTGGRGVAQSARSAPTRGGARAISRFSSRPEKDDSRRGRSPALFDAREPSFTRHSSTPSPCREEILDASEPSFTRHSSVPYSRGDVLHASDPLSATDRERRRENLLSQPPSNTHSSRTLVRSNQRKQSRSLSPTWEDRGRRKGHRHHPMSETEQLFELQAQNELLIQDRKRMDVRISKMERRLGSTMGSEKSVSTGVVSTGVSFDDDDFSFPDPKEDRDKAMQELTKAVFHQMERIKDERRRHDRTKRELEYVKSQYRQARHEKKEYAAAVIKFDKELRACKAEIQHLRRELALRISGWSSKSLRGGDDVTIVSGHDAVEVASETGSKADGGDTLRSSQSTLKGQASTRKEEKTERPSREEYETLFQFFVQKVQGEMRSMKERNDELEQRASRMEGRVKELEGEKEKDRKRHEDARNSPNPRAPRSTVDLEELASAVTSADGNEGSQLDVVQARLEVLGRRNEDQLRRLMVGLEDQKGDTTTTQQQQLKTKRQVKPPQQSRNSNNVSAANSARSVTTSDSASDVAAGGVAPSAHPTPPPSVVGEKGVDQRAKGTFMSW